MFILGKSQQNAMAEAEEHLLTHLLTTSQGPIKLLSDIEEVDAETELLAR